MARTKVAGDTLVTRARSAALRRPALRALSLEDAAWLDPWLPAAAASAGSDTTSASGLFVRASREPGLRLRAVMLDARPIGIVVYSFAGSENARGRSAPVTKARAAPPLPAHGARASARRSREAATSRDDRARTRAIRRSNGPQDAEGTSAAVPAIIELIALAPEHARRGLGMRAAAPAEEELRAGGAERILAPATEQHGIALYFWIRLGYRPLERAAWPCRRPATAWLVRDES